MSNQTPPAWAIKEAKYIIRINQWFVVPNDDTLARAIASHAPDAEALAVALEAYVRECKAQGIKLGSVTGDAEDALAAYRAAHPKVNA